MGRSNGPPAQVNSIAQPFVTLLMQSNSVPAIKAIIAENSLLSFQLWPVHDVDWGVHLEFQSSKGSGSIEFLPYQRGGRMLHWSEVDPTVVETAKMHHRHQANENGSLCLLLEALDGLPEGVRATEADVLTAIREQFSLCDIVASANQPPLAVELARLAARRAAHLHVSSQEPGYHEWEVLLGAYRVPLSVKAIDPVHAVKVAFESWTDDRTEEQKFWRYGTWELYTPDSPGRAERWVSDSEGYTAQAREKGDWDGLTPSWNKIVCFYSYS
jgi:hypothetical protein